MKKLSVEEKAKRYDEALKVLHKYDGANIMFSQSLKEEMFPELAKSEDERIRKEIIATIHLYYGEPLEDEAKEMIAWLEKQGKPTDIPADAVLDGNKDGLIAETIRYKREKQGEQKPWSEEDEVILRTIISDGIRGAGFDSLQIDWLKSLKDRAQPQPKQEWSEDDELRLDDIKTIIEESIFSKVVKDKNLNWLKSLRPQSQWKPSDGQIKVCKEVYADILSAKGFDLGTVNSELNRLEEHLNKLREE